LEYNSIYDEGVKNSIIFSEIYKIVLGLSSLLECMQRWATQIL